MDKPKSLRMRLHEMNRPPEYLQAYPAEEMDEYLDYLDFTINGYKFCQQGDARLVEDMKEVNSRLRAENARLRDNFDLIIAARDKFKAESARLREAGNKMARFISTWQDCLEGVQMTSEDFNENCGLSDWLNARATLVKED